MGSRPTQDKGVMDVGRVEEAGKCVCVCVGGGGGGGGQRKPSSSLLKAAGQL